MSLSDGVKRSELSDEIVRGMQLDRVTFSMGAHVPAPLCVAAIDRLRLALEDGCSVVVGATVDVHARTGPVMCEIDIRITSSMLRVVQSGCEDLVQDVYMLCQTCLLGWVAALGGGLGPAPDMAENGGSDAEK